MSTNRVSRRSKRCPRDPGSPHVRGSCVRGVLHQRNEMQVVFFGSMKRKFSEDDRIPSGRKLNSKPMTNGMTPQTSCLAVCFPCRSFPMDHHFLFLKIKFGFINLEASQRRCRKVGVFFQREFLGEQRPNLHLPKNPDMS